MKPWPLVSVGLPTYNRATTLTRAIKSVLVQDYPNLELIISDNASTDETQTICEHFCRSDSRVKYLRQAGNAGPALNFQAVLDAAQGEFFMWLADDDWLDPGYVAECARMLAANSDYQLVCGRARYFEGEQFRFAEAPINLAEDSSSERVFSYYRQVTMNGMFYGLMRRNALANIEIGDSLGRDWLMMAQIAFLGKVRTLESVSVNRSLAGSSQDIEQLALRHGLPRLVARNAHLLIGFHVFRDICWVSPVYKPLRKWARVCLGVRSGVVVAKRYVLPAWLKHWERLRAHLLLRTRLKRCLRSIMRKAL